MSLCHSVTRFFTGSTQYSVSGSVLHCFALAWFLLPPTTPFYLKRLSSHQHHSDSKSDWGFAPYNIPLSSVNCANGWPLGWPGILCLDITWIRKDEALLSIIKKGCNRFVEACIWSKLEYTSTQAYGVSWYFGVIPEYWDSYLFKCFCEKTRIPSCQNTDNLHLTISESPGPNHNEPWKGKTYNFKLEVCTHTFSLSKWSVTVFFTWLCQTRIYNIFWLRQ